MFEVKSVPSVKVVAAHLLNDRSGSPKVLAQVISALRKNGYEVDIFTSSLDGGFLSEHSDCISVIPYVRASSRFGVLFYFFISQIRLFSKALRYRNEEVVFYSNTLLPFGLCLAGFFLKKPLICHIHETSVSPRLFKSFLRFVVALSAKKIVFVSEYLRAKEGFPGISDVVIHNAVAPPNEPFLPGFLRSKSISVTCVLMLCSLKPYKGVNEFVELAVATASQSGLFYRLVLNATQTEIDEYFRGVVLPGNIEIFSRQSDVEGFYSWADLVVNLTRVSECVETFGLTIIEGFSYGLPAIVPPVGGPAEIVEEGVNGYRVDSRDLRLLVDVVLRLHKDRNLLKVLQKNAFLSARRYSLAEFEGQIFRIFEDVEKDA